MKQHISAEQLQELTQEQKERLREWWKEHQSYYDVGVYYIDGRQVCQSVGEKTYNDTLISIKTEGAIPLLSIGQMIELLQEKVGHFGIHNMFAEIKDVSGPGWSIHKPKCFDIRANELCDALWHAVIKEVL